MVNFFLAGRAYRAPLGWVGLGAHTASGHYRRAATMFEVRVRQCSACGCILHCWHLQAAAGVQEETPRGGLLGQSAAAGVRCGRGPVSRGGRVAPARPARAAPGPPGRSGLRASRASQAGGAREHAERPENERGERCERTDRQNHLEACGVVVHPCAASGQGPRHPCPPCCCCDVFAWAAPCKAGRGGAGRPQRGCCRAGSGASVC